MRIQKVENTSVINKNRNAKSFKGYVNGKYYEDWIIKEAKEALDNPKWQDKFLEKKKSVSQSLKTWQDTLDTGGEEENIATRVFLGVCSLGISEIGFGALGILEDRDENKRIDKTISTIKDCIIDILNGGGKQGSSR